MTGTIFLRGTVLLVLLLDVAIFASSALSAVE